ncbi:FCS-Like Zinc finger 5-like [Lycium ferocissimum]|uniref:FCS-Like Zinc finger 5-like n=1 Tax=Lycium ferocissimum TaxID=112874 RepID=UPI0028150313|nr:FCS-Like Zinc finger 5-like [Lycium ferocissimum]
MLLGKRTRPPMKRTTSMTEFSLDLNLNPDPSSAISNNYNNLPFDPHNPFTPIPVPSNTNQQLDQQRLLTTSKTIPTRNRRKSADFVETASFLKACFLCKRHLIPGRDIYMYRGDSAFCSLECRQQQMNLDEKKEKCSLVVSRKDFKNSTAIVGGKGSDVSATSETVAAV